jgi:hypothetical protein
MRLITTTIKPIMFAGLAVALGAAALSAAPPEILHVRQPQPPEIVQQMRMQQLPETAADRAVDVRKYERLELRVDLRATFQNPYDPDEIDLWAEFKAPSGKVWKIWGFYNPSTWAALWMVRFTPDEVGTWRAIVNVKDREGAAQSKAREIQVLESAHRGFVRIAPNMRYLQFSDGTPFYGVGLWYNDGYELFNKGQITENALDDLKRHGGNFISFFHSPLETMGTGLGRYDENRAGRLDEVFDWCEKRDIQISWNIWFHSYFSEAVWGGGNARYRNNPYRQVASAENFFTSPEAWKYKEKLHRYMVARWGYSRALMLWFVVDEINGTEGWLKGGSEGAEQWSRKIHDWFRANDPYHRPTTGTQSGGIKQWWANGYQIFDIAAREIYELQGHPMPPTGKRNVVSENPIKFSYLNYAKQTQDMWNGFTKPVIIGECGYDHTYDEVGTPGYLEMYHNSLWAGLANGLSMTPFWWSHGGYINDAVFTRTLPYFAAFVRDIDFTKGDFKPVTVKMSAGDGWAMQGEAMTFGWVVNSLTGVASETTTVPGLPDGEYDFHLYRPWRGVYAPVISAVSKDGALTVTLPELKPTASRVQNLGSDAAFKIVKKGVRVNRWP